MTPLVYKLRAKNPNYPNMANQMENYVFYMAYRDGVVNNADMGHGLFGKVDNNLTGDFNSIENVAKTARYVKRKVNSGTIMYDNIISISKEDFMRLGFDNQQAWKDLIKSETHKMAEKIGIPPSQLEYVAAMHIKNGKPDCHLLFWDRNQGVKKAYVHPKTAASIRANFIKVIYAEELAELHQIKNEARDTITSEADDFYKDFMNPLQTMSNKEYKELENKIKENSDMNLGGLFDINHIPKILLDETAHKIIVLKEALPKEGRIAYKLLPPDVKAVSDEIIEDLINNIPEFKKEFDTYKQTSRKIASFYSSNEKALDKAEKKAHEDLRKRLANRLLIKIKTMNWVHEMGARREKQMLRNMAVNNIMDLFKILTGNNEAQNKKYDNYKGELSKQARKEMAIKMQNAGGIDWDNDR